MDNRIETTIMKLYRGIIYVGYVWGLGFDFELRPVELNSSPVISNPPYSNTPLIPSKGAYDLQSTYITLSREGEAYSISRNPPKSGPQKLVKEDWTHSTENNWKRTT